MNKENLLRVADAIEKHEISWLGYNQSFWISENRARADMSGHACGTTACLAGWACAVKSKGQGPEFLPGLDGIRYQAKEFLGLTNDEAKALFQATPYYGYDPQASDAVEVLRHAAEHNVIVWPVRKDEGGKALNVDAYEEANPDEA